MSEQTERSYRPRAIGVRRIPLGTAVHPDLHKALTDEAAEKGCTLSMLAADVLAAHAGVPA